MISYITKRRANVIKLKSIVSDTTITIATAGVAIATNDVYEIYKGNVAGSEGYSLYFGTTGDVKITDVSGNTTTINNIPAGKILDLQVVKFLLLHQHLLLT